MTVELLPRPLRPGLYVLPAGILILFTAWPLATLPGEGLNLTLNLLTWLGCALWGLSLLPALLRRHWQGRVTCGLLAAGAVLMSIPWLWTPHTFQQMALYRLTGLWTLVLLVAVLRQIPLHGLARRRICTIIVIAGILQTLLANWQLMWPDAASNLTGFNLSRTGGRPTGSFLQANLLGSFVATAFLCCLWLVFSPLSMKGRRYALLGVFILSAGIAMSLSRTALFAALPAAVLLLCLIKGQHRVRLIAIGALMAGLLAGQGILFLRPALHPTTAGDVRPVNTEARLQHDRQHSGAERLALLQGTSLIIATTPWSGSGLGTFERRFPDALAEAGAVNPFTVTVSHPHNELLYVWSEGGVVAAAGLMLWLGLWGSLFLRRRRRVAMRALLTVPLVAHCMTEMPLYLSAIHLILLALLFRMALPVRCKKALPVSPGAVRPVAVTGLAIICLAGGTFMVTALQSSSQLQSAESFRLMDPVPLTAIRNPLAQPDRLLFDRTVNLLMMYNLQPDPMLLDRFTVQATDWLTRHNDASLTATLMQLAHHRGDTVRQQYWRRRGCQSFQQDRRFDCPHLPLISGDKR